MSSESHESLAKVLLNVQYLIVVDDQSQDDQLIRKLSIRSTKTIKCDPVTIMLRFGPFTRTSDNINHYIFLTLVVLYCPLDKTLDKR